VPAFSRLVSICATWRATVGLDGTATSSDGVQRPAKSAGVRRPRLTPGLRSSRAVCVQLRHGLTERGALRRRQLDWRAGERRLMRCGVYHGGREDSARLRCESPKLLVDSPQVLALDDQRFAVVESKTDRAPRHRGSMAKRRSALLQRTARCAQGGSAEACSNPQRLWENNRRGHAPLRPGEPPRCVCFCGTPSRRPATPRRPCSAGGDNPAVDVHPPAALITARLAGSALALALKPPRLLHLPLRLSHLA
jgi:hypothetical protein